MDDWGLILVLTFAGSALGGVARYGVSQWVARHCGEGFPLGILVVNVSGAFGVGVAWVLAWPQFPGVPEQAFYAFFVLGFFGGYTTVSSNVLDSLTLLRKREWARAGLNVFGTLALCLAAVFAGVGVGEWVRNGL